jgi:hypothetical protein
MYSDLDGGKSVREEGEEARNLEHTVVPNAALWNFGFQGLRMGLFNVFESK